jgi:hypothetical protein
VSSSKFQDIRTALISLINTRLSTQSITGVVVTDFPPLGDVAFDDRIYLGRIRVDQEPLGMGGADRLVDEDITVELFVVASKPGGDNDDMKACEERAETIFSAVENGLRASSSVSSTVMFAEVAAFESVPFASENRVGVMIEATVTAIATV